MNWQISLAITVAVVALVLVAMQWQKALDKNDKLSVANAALMEYVQTRKDIDDKYGPIFNKLPHMSNGPADVDDDALIDSLPDNQHPNTGLRPSTKATKAKN